MRASRKTRLPSRALAILLAFTMVAAACGDDDDGGTTTVATTQPDSGPETTAPEEEGEDDRPDDTVPVQTAPPEEEASFDPAGVLRIGASVVETGSLTQFDPISIVSPADGGIMIQSMIYGTLLRRLADGEYEPWLALSAETVDPQTIVVELRPDVVFSDGEPFGAEAVAAGILRNVVALADNPGALSVELGAVEDVTVDGPLTVTIKLSQPIAGAFYPLLARGETMIVSPKAVADGVDLKTNPVGAGPFVLESLTMEDKIVLAKSETYYDADNVRVAGVEVVHTASPEATVNALRTGAIDIADVALSQVADSVQGVAGLEVFRKVNDSTLFWGQICKSRPPFDDVRVRQAMNFGLDRDELNQAIYDGDSVPMTGGINLPGSFLSDPELEGFYDYDPDRARELLAEAGYENGFDMQLIHPAEGGDGATFATVVQAQWAQIGINVELVPLPNADIVPNFFLDQTRYPLYFFPLQRNGIDKISRTLQLGGLGNICGWDDPDLNALVDELRTLDPTSDAAQDAWFRLDRHILETAAQIFGIFGVTANIAHTDRVGDLRYAQNFQGQPFIMPDQVYIKA